MSHEPGHQLTPIEHHCFNCLHDYGEYETDGQVKHVEYCCECGRLWGDGEVLPEMVITVPRCIPQVVTDRLKARLEAKNAEAL